MLKINNLNVFYGGLHVLKGINIEVPEGLVITLIGANGAGKSSILRSIAGLVKPQNGQIIYEGKDITAAKTYERLGLGIVMVPEGRRIFTNMSVLENLQMGAYIRVDKETIKQDYASVYSLFPKLKERSNQKAITLSGGEQQMLAMGRALMSRPRLLLMDEPSLGLAPNLVDEMYRTISKIHDEGLTILLVEQNANLALGLADYGYVLELGRIILEGPCKVLANNEDVKKAYIGA